MTKYLRLCFSSRVRLGAHAREEGSDYASRQWNVHEKIYPTHDMKLATVLFALKI